MNLEVDSKDIIRLMLQFMKENNLTESMKSLQKETNVSLNTVPNIEHFISDIHSGHWDTVLVQLTQISLPSEKLIEIYEQVFLELLEAGERDIAREFLRVSDPFTIMKSESPERFVKLEHLCQRPYFYASDAYDPGSSKEKRRHEIADAIRTEISIVPPSRLLFLINQALRYQHSQGLLPKEIQTGGSKTRGTNERKEDGSGGGGGGGGVYDLFRGGTKQSKSSSSSSSSNNNNANDEKMIKKYAGKIKFSPESHPETVSFSPDGSSLITGSVDGFIEVWDSETCKLKLDLEYQKNDEFMMHDNGDSILSSTFTREGDYLATGSMKGQVKIWKLSTGLCVKRFPSAHTQGITSVLFSRDGNQLITTSYDMTARIHGMKSGKTLKEFRGHTSYVNSSVLSRDGQSLLTCSSDSTVRVWDLKTADCLINYRPGLTPHSSHKEVSVHSILLLPPCAPIFTSPSPSSPSSSSSASISSSLSSSSSSSSSLSSMSTSIGSTSSITNPTSLSSSMDHIIAVSKSPTAHLVTLHGQLIKSFYSGKPTGGDFVSAAISPQGKWLYCLGEDGIIYVFDIQGGVLENLIDVKSGGAAGKGGSGGGGAGGGGESEGDVIGLFHHPHRSVLGTFSDSGQLKLWK